METVGRNLSAGEFGMCRGEIILWSGRPAFIPFVIKSILATGAIGLIVAMIIGAVYHVLQSEKIMDKGGLLVASPLVFVLLLILMCSLINTLERVFACNKTLYVCTDQGILVVGGSKVGNLTAIPYGNIVETMITFGSIERMLGVGSVKFFSGRFRTSNQFILNLYDQMVGIQNPEEVMKIINEQTRVRQFNRIAQSGMSPAQEDKAQRRIDIGTIWRNAVVSGMSTMMVVNILTIMTGSGRWFWKLSAFWRIFGTFALGVGIYLLIFWLMRRLRDDNTK